MSIRGISLVPNSIDHRSKSLTVSEEAWKRAVELVDAAGYRPNHHAGLDRRTANYFAQCLRRGLSREAVGEAGEELHLLLSFLDGPGAGGFGLTRGYKKWNQK